MSVAEPRTAARAGPAARPKDRIVRLKRSCRSDETPGVKACPFCEAELRDSVIKCTRCGRPLLERREPAADPRAFATPPASRSPSFAPAPPALAPPSRTVTPAAVFGPRTAPIPDVVTRRALPTGTRRAGRPDLVLLLMALVSAGAGFVAWRSVADPWARLIVTDTSDRLDPVLVGDVVLRAELSVLGTIARGLAAALVAFAVLWFVYGVDRGSTMPWFTNPAAAMLVSLAGIGATVLSALVWFVWEDAAVGRSRALGMSADELRELLDQQPPPLVQIERLSGLLRFGGVMLLALLAAATAWWAYRKRN